MKLERFAFAVVISAGVASGAFAQSRKDRQNQPHFSPPAQRVQAPPRQSAFQSRPSQTFSRPQQTFSRPVQTFTQPHTWIRTSQPANQFQMFSRPTQTIRSTQTFRSNQAFTRPVQTNTWGGFGVQNHSNLGNVQQNSFSNLGRNLRQNNANVSHSWAQDPRGPANTTHQTKVKGEGTPWAQDPRGPANTTHQTKVKGEGTPWARDPRGPAINNHNFTNNRQQMEQQYQQESWNSHAQVRDFHGRENGNWGDHWRYGYFQRPDWDDSSFHFGFYIESPFAEACVPSPWYYYPVLPPYLSESVVYVRPDYFDWHAGVAFNPYNDAAVNDSVQDIVSSFENGDPSAMSAVLPSSGTVAIYSDGQYEYSLNSSDFATMLADNLQGTQTVSFQVSSVRRSGNNAIVDCVHTFSDPNGGEDTVYQEYRLRNEYGRYVVADFMTSQNPSF